MPLKVRLLGVRGSRPTHKKELLGFGGNSTSIEFLCDERCFIFLDGGSGLAHRGFELGDKHQDRPFYLLVTHTHWDHLLGYPFFEPFYHGENKFSILASETSQATFSKLFYGLHSATHLPLPTNRLKAKLEFIPVKSGARFTLQDTITITTHQINHQGITLAYRVAYDGGSAAVVTDNAPIDNGNYLGEGMKEQAKSDPKKFEADFNAGLVHFLTDCHTVIFDTHFTEANLKPDWGHSTPERALEFCIKARVKRLILFHHAPEDLDADVARKVVGVRERGLQHGIEIVAAKEGDTWLASQN